MLLTYFAKFSGKSRLTLTFTVNTGSLVLTWIAVALIYD